MKNLPTLFIVWACLIFTNSQVNSQDYNDNWPNWRGPKNDGVSLTGTPPTEWSEIQNVKWKTQIPGKGVGTPIVWGNQIFITTVIELDQKATEEAVKKLKKTSPIYVKMMGWSGTTEHLLQFVVYSIDRNTGEIKWEKVVREQFPHEGIHTHGSWASASCATNGKDMLAYFGSYGLYCFDMEGNLNWEKDFGDMQVESAFGEGTTPVLYDDKVIIVWDHEGQSKLHTLNLKTGEEIWQKERDESTTWATPIVVEVEGNAQIIVPGEKKSMGYNLENGDVIWEVSGLGDGVISTPVFDGERTFLMTGFGKSKIVQAINVRAAHDKSEVSNAVSWSRDKYSSYVPSPMIIDGKLYYLKSSGPHLSCVESSTGKVYYEAQKLDGLKGIYASPVYANGNIYIIDRNGTCSVVESGVEFRIVAQNKLDDQFDASPVVVGNDLLLRGVKSLYCISK